VDYAKGRLSSCRLELPLTEIPFSQALRERTRSSHSDSEGAGFMNDLMTGKGTRDDYVALVVQHYFIYEALESVQPEFADNATAAPFISAHLTRLPALEADLEFLIGPQWSDEISPLPTTELYVKRIHAVGAERWAGGFVAHHYTRYLGDLSGGQAISRIMQRQFGFEAEGVAFYLFDQITDAKQFKEAYRDHLDAAEWDAAERERVIDEVVTAYRFNTELFVDLAASNAAA
jgi:heme oxygenase (biliverdin-producing, ferredoxin)